MPLGKNDRIIQCYLEERRKECFSEQTASKQDTETSKGADDYFQSNSNTHGWIFLIWRMKFFPMNQKETLKNGPC